MECNLHAWRCAPHESLAVTSCPSFLSSVELSICCWNIDLLRLQLTICAQAMFPCVAPAAGLWRLHAVMERV